MQSKKQLHYEIIANQTAGIAILNQNIGAINKKCGIIHLCFGTCLSIKEF